MRALNSLLAVVVTLGLFGLAMEGGLRLIGRGPAVTLNQFDPVTGWAKVPGLRVQRRTAEFTVDFAFNSLGLREDEGVTPETLPEDALRVLCLGDSFVLGYGVQREDHLVDLLERELARGGRPVEVVNVGTEGWSTDQEVAWLEAHGEEWRPDLVLLLPYENDLYWNTQDRYLRFPKPRYREDGTREEGALVDPGPRPLADRSALLSLVLPAGLAPPVEVHEGHTLLAEHTVLLEGGGPHAAEVQARLRGSLLALARWSAERAVPVLVAPLPSHGAIEERYATEVFGPRVLDGLPRGDWSPDRPVELVLGTCGDLGLDTHDLRPALRLAASTGATPYHEVDWHFDAEGSQLVADDLAKALRDRGLAPQAADAPMPPPAERDSDLPRWPLWYAGLLLALSTAYRRAYPDEAAGRVTLQVALLLAVIFNLALGGSRILGALPPAVSALLAAGLLLLLLGFCAWKLGDRLGTIAELVGAFIRRGHWYLMPLLVVLLTVGSLLVVAASSPLVAPFIYTLF